MCHPPHISHLFRLLPGAVMAWPQCSRGHGHGFRIRPRTHGGEQHRARSGTGSRAGFSRLDSAPCTMDPTGSTGPADLSFPTTGTPEGVRSHGRAPVRAGVVEGARTRPRVPERGVPA